MNEFPFKWAALVKLIHKVAAMNDYDKTSHAECFT